MNVLKFLVLGSTMISPPLLQVMQQFPLSFEFNEGLLHNLFVHSYSSVYGTLFTRCMWVTLLLCCVVCRHFPV